MDRSLLGNPNRGRKKVECEGLGGDGGSGEREISRGRNSMETLRGMQRRKLRMYSVVLEPDRGLADGFREPAEETSTCKGELWGASRGAVERKTMLAKSMLQVIAGGAGKRMEKKASNYATRVEKHLRIHVCTHWVPNRPSALLLRGSSAKPLGDSRHLCPGILQHKNLRSLVGQPPGPEFF